MKYRNIDKRQPGRPKKCKFDFSSEEGAELKDLVWEALKGNPIGEGGIVMGATAWVKLVEIVLDRGVVDVDMIEEINEHEDGNTVSQFQIDLPME